MNTTKLLLQEYVNSFTEKEKKAYDIARSHLGSSFSLEKSVGFIQWLKLRLADASVQDAKT
jgi:hypothetical protein